MKILGIDSSGMVASVAIIQDDVIKAEYTMNHKKTHSETLLPMIDEIVKTSEIRLEELDAIAIAAGPGSFTGLRIGAATAKGLAMAIDKPIIPVKTCEGLAFNMWGADGLIVPMMDQTPMDIHELVEKVNEMATFDGKPFSEVTFLGDGVPIYEDVIWKEIKLPCKTAPASISRQRAASVATYGEILYKEKKFVNADDFAPEYLRKSQAERVRDEKSN